ncbi:DMT family transporter [Microbulbifer guangxiensis]|uniref:DMT family transporter n=1 Tax=Microbulbifer guangxiensis TaxID=2904249 RepID=UPI001F350E94
MAGASAALVALAAMCWGLSGGIAGMLIADGWNPLVVSFFRGAIGFVLFFAWLLIRRDYTGLGDSRLWFWSVLAGLGVSGNFAFYFISIAYSGVAVAVTLMYSAPVIVYLVSFALRLEQPSPIKLMAIASVMLGILLLTQVYESGRDGIALPGIATGLLAGLSYAVFIFSFQYAAPRGNPRAVLTIAFAMVALSLVWPAGTDLSLAMLDGKALPSLLLLGVLGSGLSFFFFVIALKHITPTVAAVLAMVEPVTASLFGLLVLDENLTTPQVVGMALILFTVTALVIHSRTRPLKDGG